MTVPRAERRLAAILAADIVGYSRLVDQDEAGTLAAIKGLRETTIDPIVAEHLGRIVKLMGDGMIVEFGSVVGAVACAIAVQKAVTERQFGVPAERRVVFRIGINLGDVVVDGDDLLGDGVIVAARLEQLCEPGGVLVSGTAYDQLQGKLGLPLEFTGEQRVKNIARPVRAYRVRLDGKPARPAWPWRNLRLGAAAATLIVAVLPLENRSGDTRLADSMIEVAAKPERSLFQQLGNEQLALETAEGNAKAIDLLRRAVELQPENSYTRTWLASAYRQQVDEDLAPRAAAMASWLDAATTAVRLDLLNIENYRWAQRNAYFSARRYAEAAAAEAIGEPTRWGKLYNTLIHAQLGRDAEVERWRTSPLADDPRAGTAHREHREGRLAPLRHGGAAGARAGHAPHGGV